MYSELLEQKEYLLYVALARTAPRDSVTGAAMVGLKEIYYEVKQEEAHAYEGELDNMLDRLENQVELLAHKFEAVKEQKKRERRRLVKSAEKPHDFTTLIVRMIMEGKQ